LRAKQRTVTQWITKIKCKSIKKWRMQGAQFHEIDYYAGDILMLSEVLHGMMHTKRPKTHDFM